MAITFECRSCGARAEAASGVAAPVCPACGVTMAPVAAGAAAVKTAAPIATAMAGATPQIPAPPTVKRAMPIGVPPAGVVAATAALAGVKVARPADQTITAAGVSSDTTKRLQALKERAASVSAADLDKLRDEALQQVRAQAQEMLNQARIQEQEIVRRAQQTAAAEAQRQQEAARQETALAREAAASEIARVREETAAEMGKAREVFDAEIGEARELALADAARVKEQARKDAAEIRQEAEARCRQDAERALAASRETAAAEAKHIVTQAQADAEKRAAELLAEARGKAAAEQGRLLAEARQQAAAEAAKPKDETARKLEENRQPAQDAKTVPAAPPPGGPAKVPAFGARKPAWGRGPVAAAKRDMAPGGKGPATRGAAAESGARQEQGEPVAAAASAPRRVGYRDAETHGMSDVEKAHYTARRDLLNEHAKQEARSLMFGLIASAILAFYLLYVLFRGNPVEPLRYATIGLLSADVLFVLWQVWTVFRHLLQGKQATAAHKERLKAASAAATAARPVPGGAAGSGAKASATFPVLPRKGLVPGKPAVAPVPVQARELPPSGVTPETAAPTAAAKTGAPAPVPAVPAESASPAAAVKSAGTPVKPMVAPRSVAEDAAIAAELAALKAELVALKAEAAKLKSAGAVAKPNPEIDALKSETAALKTAAETARQEAETARAETAAVKEELATRNAGRQVSTVPVDADLPQLFGCDADEFVLGIRKPRLPPEDGSAAPAVTVASKRERRVAGLWRKLFADPASSRSGNDQPAVSPPKG